MTQKISFLPSGRTCRAETNETILEACLRSGLSPNYGCSNGNCGSCTARLKSGQIEQVRHHDYALTAAELNQDGFLMCSNRALNDVEVEADVTQSPDDIPVQSVEAKVKAVEHLDPQVIALHLQTRRIRRLRFIAGQSVTLAIGDEHQTKLAIASCPCDDRNLHFHVPLIPDDAFSEFVFSGRLEPRTKVTVKGPEKGTFYLDDKDERHSLILCWHTGFAPVASLMEHLMALEVEKDIHLFRFSPTPDQQYLSNLCRSWADAYDNIEIQMMPERVTLLSSVEACTNALAGITAKYPDLSKLNIYVAGPPNFVEAASRTFSEPSQPVGQFRTHTDWVGTLD